MVKFYNTNQTDWYEANTLNMDSLGKFQERHKYNRLDQERILQPFQISASPEYIIYCLSQESLRASLETLHDGKGAKAAG